MSLDELKALEPDSGLAMDIAARVAIKMHEFKFKEPLARSAQEAMARFYAERFLNSEDGTRVLEKALAQMGALKPPTEGLRELAGTFAGILACQLAEDNLAIGFYDNGDFEGDALAALDEWRMSRELNARLSQPEA